LLGNRSLKIRDFLKNDYKIPQSLIEINLGRGVKNKEEKIIINTRTSSIPSGKEKGGG